MNTGSPGAKGMISQTNMERLLAAAAKREAELRAVNAELVEALTVTAEACRKIPHDAKMHGVLTENLIEHCKFACDDARTALKKVEAVK